MLAARAQQPKLPVIGFLNSGSPGAFGPVVSAFRLGLGEAGYVEHRDVGIEYSWAERWRMWIDCRRSQASSCALGLQRSVPVAPGRAGGEGGYNDNPGCFHQRRGSHQIGSGDELQPAWW